MYDLGSYVVTALPWVPMYMELSVNCPRVESLLPKVLRRNSAGLHSQVFWGILRSMPEPQADEHDMGLRTFNLVGKQL